MNRVVLFAIAGLVVIANGRRAGAVETVHLSNRPNEPLVNQVVNTLSVDFFFYLSDQHLTVELSAGEIIYDPCPQCGLAVDLPRTQVFLGDPANEPPILEETAKTPTHYEVIWAPHPLTIEQETNYPVAHVVLSDDAQGSWSYRGNEASPVALIPPAPTIHGLINGGVMTQIPEPSTIAGMLVGLLIYCGCRKGKLTTEPRNVLPTVGEPH